VGCLIGGSNSFAYNAGLAIGAISDTGFLPLSLLFLRYFCLSDSNLVFFLSSSTAEGCYGLATTASSFCSIVLAIAGDKTSCSAQGLGSVACYPPGNTLVKASRFSGTPNGLATLSSLLARFDMLLTLYTSINCNEFVVGCMIETVSADILWISSCDFFNPFD